MAPTVTSAYQQTPPGWADAVVPQPGLQLWVVTHTCQRWNLETTLTKLPKQYICKTPTLTPYPGKYKAVLTICVWSHAPLLPHYLQQLQDHEEDPISVLYSLSQKFHLIRVKVVQILLLIKNGQVKKVIIKDIFNLKPRHWNQTKHKRPGRHTVTYSIV